jgi:integrase
MERMRRRRFQNPKPKLRGNWWELRVWREAYVEGHLVRKRAYLKLAKAETGERQVLKLAAVELNKLNLGLLDNAAIPFENFVEEYYTPKEMPLLATSSRGRTKGVLKNYLTPMFGRCSLHEITYGLLQSYFSGMETSELSHESRDKIRDVLSSVLGAAVREGMLPKNPMENVRMPPDRRGKRTHKPHLTPEQFALLIDTIQEPYATMVYVAIYTGLRVSELIGLRWEDVHEDSITVDERCCRGDWGAPKSDSSNATIGVNSTVIERLHRLKLLTVEGRCGGKGAVRKYKVVKKDGPLDLVFQSLRTGVSMRDNNILSRHLKPAGRKLGMGFVNWRCLRTSHATWLKMAGADVKDAQAQMRHSRASTTLDIYQQFVPESQKKVVAKRARKR